jgi:hypothetical protein
MMRNWRRRQVASGPQERRRQVRQDSPKRAIGEETFISSAAGVRGSEGRLMAYEPVIEMDRMGRLGVLSRGDPFLLLEGACLLLALWEQVSAPEDAWPLTAYLMGKIRAYDLAVDLCLSQIWYRLSQWFFNSREADWSAVAPSHREEAHLVRLILEEAGTANWTDAWPQFELFGRRLDSKASWDEAVGSLGAISQRCRLPFLWRLVTESIWMAEEEPIKQLRPILQRYCEAPQSLTPVRWDYVIDIEFTHTPGSPPVFKRAVYRRAAWNGWAPIIIHLL